MKYRVQTYCFLLVVFVLASAGPVSAQLSPANCAFQYDDEFEVADDCDNPFGTPLPNQNLVVSIGIEALVADAEYEFFGTSQTISITGASPQASGASAELFHERTITNPVTGAEATIYQSLLFFDPVRNSSRTYAFATSGQYYLVVREEQFILSQNWLQKLRGTLLATAHAAVGDRTVIPFTVADPVAEPPAPAGASSVLFLPGIQASRLYERDFGTDSRRWEPFGNRDVRALEMTEAGTSVNDIYTEDILDEIYGVINIYEAFGQFMDDLVTDGIIAGWQPFAYDWRYDVMDIAQNGTQYENEIRSPIAEIEALAAESKTGQVTLVGHSNGGLLAKAIMVELESQGKADLVDRVVFLASPQIGTPKAIGSILHGYDQQDGTGGLIIADTTARSVILNLPGAYGLLPSQQYFDSVNDLIVLFDTSASTADFRSEYGNAIQSASELTDFMTAADGRTEAETAEEAAKANSGLLANSIASRAVLDAWIAPDVVEVVEIVGVGIDTVSGFQYTEFTERVCTDPDVFGIRDCEIANYYEPVPFISQYGDETVMAQSAEAYQGNKETFYVDLNAIILAANDGLNVTKVTHSNIGESEPIQQLMRNLLTSTATPVDFVSTRRPEYVNGRSLLGTHSPVTMTLIDSEGRQVGVFDEGGQVPVVREDIPGSSYFQFGSSTYITVPKDLAYEVTIVGYDEGGMTLTVHDLTEEEQRLVSKVSVATVTASTNISFSRQPDTGFSNTEIDIDGDSITDLELTPAGEVVVDEVATYAVLRQALKALELSSRQERKLLFLAKFADYFDKKSVHKPVYTRLEKRLLKRLDTLLVWHEARGRITRVQLEELQGIINKLKS